MAKTAVEPAAQIIDKLETSRASVALDHTNAPASPNASGAKITGLLEKSTPTPGAGLDQFEARFMARGEPVAFRSKVPAFKSVTAWVAIASIDVPVSLLGGWYWFGAVNLAAAILAIVLFSVLRVVVTRYHVVIQHGVFSERIPISAIEFISVTNYSRLNFGAWWGMRPKRWRNRTMYNIFGDGGRAVEIGWRAPSGLRKITMVGTKTPESLRDAIEAARAQRDPTHDLSPELPPDPDHAHEGGPA